MSTGFETLASSGRNDRSAVLVASESGLTRRPVAAHLSAHRIPRPPAFVTIAIRSPFGGGWFARIVATSNISSSVSVRITPDWRNSASTVTSLAASSAPVCEAAARAPAALRPDFTATIGLRRLVLRRGPPNPPRVPHHPGERQL